jgi:hypothetical protein
VYVVVIIISREKPSRYNLNMTITRNVLMASPVSLSSLLLPPRLCAISLLCLRILCLDTLRRYVGSFDQLRMSKEEIVPFPNCRIGFCIFLTHFLSGLTFSTPSAGDQNQGLLTLGFQSRGRLVPLSPSNGFSIFPTKLLTEIQGPVSDVLT